MSPCLAMTSPTLRPMRKHIDGASGWASLAFASTFWILDGTVHGVDHAGKFRERAIVGGVRYPAPVAVDELIEQGSMSRQCRHCRFFIAVHHAAIALDI